MDIYSLVAANLHSGARPALKDAKSEDRYYSDQVALPRLGPGLLGSIAVCALLILVGMPPS
ncbi:hypothetical protein [Mesorhizobium sp. M1112]|jgi:hypothetical protein|uniref:hypothetical protein n=1 Tax=unclassified Mesorhizobium TaxID=325217 RepID=UPI00333BD663